MIRLLSSTYFLSLGSISISSERDSEWNTCQDQPLPSTELNDSVVTNQTHVITECRDAMRQTSREMRARFDAYWVELLDSVKKAEITVARWTSFSECLIRFEKWLDGVECDWSIKEDEEVYRKELVASLSAVKALVTLYRVRRFYSCFALLDVPCFSPTFCHGSKLITLLHSLSLILKRTLEITFALLHVLYCFYSTYYNY